VLLLRWCCWPDLEVEQNLGPGCGTSLQFPTSVLLSLHNIQLPGTLLFHDSMWKVLGRKGGEARFMVLSLQLWNNVLTSFRSICSSCPPSSSNPISLKPPSPWVTTGLPMPLAKLGLDACCPHSPSWKQVVQKCLGHQMPREEQVWPNRYHSLRYSSSLVDRYGQPQSPTSPYRTAVGRHPPVPGSSQLPSRAVSFHMALMPVPSHGPADSQGLIKQRMEAVGGPPFYL
jgi:hypothetical protein